MRSLSCEIGLLSHHKLQSLEMHFGFKLVDYQILSGQNVTPKFISVGYILGVIVLSVLLDNWLIMSF